MRSVQRIRTGLAIAIAVLAIGSSAPRAGWAQAQPPACERRSFEGAAFTVCLYEAGRDELSLALGGRDGPLGGLRALKRHLGRDSARVRFAMNGGMYDGQQRPVGLLVQAGRDVHPAETSSGRGNFYLLPNGVFWVDAAGEPHVDETGAYLARRPAAAWATQSGPLLLQAGRLHPAILENGASLNIRNGVCVPGPGRAYFVISDTPVSFGRLARFFRDALGCPDALYLDGHVSALWAPGLGRLDKQTGLGPLIVVGRPRVKATPAP